MMIFLILLIINVLATILIQADRKYFLFSVPFFLSLALSFGIWRFIADRKIHQQENKYWKSTGAKSFGDYAEWSTLEAMRKNRQQLNSIFLNAMILQAFLAFIFQVIGSRKTSMKVYSWTKWTFGILLFLLLWLKIMLSIIPARIL